MAGKAFTQVDEKLMAQLDQLKHFFSEVRTPSSCDDIQAHVYSQRSTCSKFTAVDEQGRIKYKNQVVSGIVCIVDARHGVVEPGGSVDLQISER